MSTQKKKFELFNRIQALGFTYEEAVALRRIEMTLRSWGTAQCNGEIERDEATGNTYAIYGRQVGAYQRVKIADREAGALRRLDAIIRAHKARGCFKEVVAYHQTDPRGCSLYLCHAAEIEKCRRPLSENDSRRERPGQLESFASALDSFYSTRGVAVCA